MSDACPDCLHTRCEEGCVCNCDAARAEAEAASLRARISTLEARIAELTGERDEARHAQDRLGVALGTACEDLVVVSDRLAAARARIAELERELDEARAQRLSDVMEGLVLGWDADAARRDLVAARADRDEAVRLLRDERGRHKPSHVPGCKCWLCRVDAYLLALHPAQPETPTKGPR